MSNTRLKNTVILKNPQSNIIDEAIIIFKSNEYAKKVKQIREVEKENRILENKNSILLEKIKDSKEKNKDVDKNNCGQSGISDSDNYLVKEAEFIIENYIEKIEKQNTKNIKESMISKRYKILKIYSFCLSATMITGIIIKFVFNIID